MTPAASPTERGPDASPPSATGAALTLAAVNVLLRPLVRLLIGAGVTFPVLADLLRALYVAIAEADLPPSPRDRTDSRISLLTGVHRKEIRRLRAQDRDTPHEPQAVTLSSQIVSRWLGAPGYQDASGAPLVLPRVLPDQQAGPSFERLVAAVTTDLRPRAVLDDWLAQGLVSVDAEDQVRLETQAFVPRPGRREQLFFFARNTHDHLAAACGNLSASPDAPAPWLDLSVHYDRLPRPLATRLEQVAREAAQRALLEVNGAALALLAEADQGEGQETKPEPPATEPTRRVNLGLYLYAEDEAP